MSKLPSLASAILYREVQLRNLERKKQTCQDVGQMSGIIKIKRKAA